MEEYYEMLIKVAEMALRNGDEIEISRVTDGGESHGFLSSTNQDEESVTFRSYKPEQATLRDRKDMDPIYEEDATAGTDED